MSGYGCETELLSATADYLAGCDTLITFNCRCFDAPLLESRYTMCRMANPLAGVRHLDIIYPARRAWKLRLQKCDLKRLEERILGIIREGDLPGSEVPERYFQYLKYGDIALLDDVIGHNKRDILSLGALLAKLCAVYNAPAEQADLLDLFSLGRAMERQGDLPEARKCYKIAARGHSSRADTNISALANYKLSMIHKRGGELSQAEGIWRHLADHQQLGALPFIELSKLYEHKLKDHGRALDAALGALNLASDESERQAIYARQSRLIVKIERLNKTEV
jgi:tetratricopeptide (TPR) repeat protein